MRRTGLVVMLAIAFCSYQSFIDMQKTGHPINMVKADQWLAMKTVRVGGLLGSRVDLWRNNRLWYVDRSGFLLSGFENPPGLHAWQGEHVGKWLHAATLAYLSTKDVELKKALDSTVNRLLAAQLPNGYLGTYGEKNRFYNAPADSLGWDVWTERYTIYGLLAYEKYFPSEAVVTACKQIGDLLIDVYGRGKSDITYYGTRKGLSTTTLLESIVLLYERTGEKKYLDFAEEIVKASEDKRGLHLMGEMLNKGSVVVPGDGKAYQLMSNLLGYLRLYQATGKQLYLTMVTTAWQQIQQEHLLTTGGPWTRKTSYNGNKECFARIDAFNPEELVVENCCTVTWIQLNLQLAALTGMAQYAAEAEKSIYNQLLGGQHEDGIDWCYYTKPNQSAPPYVPTIHCCASSGPRALEIFAAYVAGQIDGHLSVNYLAPAVVALEDKFGGGTLTIENNFPFNSAVDILLKTKNAKEFPVEFRIPAGTSLASVKVNGKAANFSQNERGYYQASRKWNTGDKISIQLNYLLKEHIQQGEKNKSWVAFTYGPIALAQKISGNQSLESFPQSSGKGGSVELLKRIGQPDSSIVFSVTGSNIQLIPYYQAGSRTSGPRTYFNVDPAGN